MRFFPFVIMLVLCLLLLKSNAAGFPANEKCHRSTEGQNFWFGFMEGRDKGNAGVHYIEVTVTAREATTFDIYLGKSATPYKGSPFSVGDNDSYRLKIPLSLAEAVGSETKQEKAIHLVSAKPVNVYALNWDNSSADVAVIYPVESLGKEYFAMCYTPDVVEDDLTHGRNSEFLIVASEDSTTVAITPSVVTDQKKQAGETFTVVLNKGEVYQVQSLNQNYQGQGDLTGSYVESDKPVAFYSGNYSTIIPVQQGMTGYDHLFEQIPPVQAWGREYYTVPLYTRYADRYRVMAAEDNTTVLVGTTKYTISERGDFIEFILNYNQPTRIYADKQIMVAQFSQSNRTDQSYTGGNGDPFMIILSSVSQSKNDVTFVAYDSDQIERYFVNIVSPASEVYNIEMDGVNIGNRFSSFAGTEYSYAQLSVGLGNHRIQNLDSDMGFLAYVYGYGGYESYGYGVGFNLDLILDIGQNIDFQGDTLPMCKGSQVLLDAGPYFDEYLWNTGDTTQKIIVKTEGKYRATGKTIDGCEQKDSIYVIEAGTEKPDIGADIAGCAPLSIKLNGGGGFRTYEWNTGDSTQVIQINQTGEYIVTVTDRFWCATRDTMKFTVYPVPVISLKSPSVICGTKMLKIELQFDGVDERVVNNGKMEWKTHQPTGLFFSNQANTSTDILVDGWGDYEVFYTFTTADNCVVTDTLKLKFADIPSSEFEFPDDSDDKCKGYNREVIYTGNATQNARYYWDFGNCLADSVNWNRWRVSLSPGNSQTAVSLYVEENGCQSTDTTTLIIAATPDFVMNTAKSRGCDSATIYFSGELKVSDNVVYEWNFGDGSAVSTQQNPSHFYSKKGFYDVTLKITNADNGCFTGFTEKEMVKIFSTPAAHIAIDPAACADSIVQAVYTFNIDSSFCNWDFDGAHKVGNGNDSIYAFLDNPTGTIRLQVDEYGCKSNWVEKTATRNPFFDIEAFPAEGCQPLQVTAAAVSRDERLVYTWLADSVIAGGDEHLFVLGEPGEFGLKLVAFSEVTGCSDTIFRPEMVEVFPKPVAQFEIDYPVAIIDNAKLTFTNLTEDVSKFYWDFGDGTLSAEENPQHRYWAVGKYSVGLKVESENGCRDTAFSEVEIVPFTTYTPNAFRPDSEIAENRLFMPVTVGVDPENFSLLIYNRWGELIFESYNPGNKWDGTTKNNKPAPVGNYVWKAEFLDVQGFTHSMKGQVLLIR